MFGPFGARTSSLDEWGLPEIEGEFMAEQDDVGDVVGEMTPRIFQKRRSHKWESQSLPSFSPRLSPYPSPPATPSSSRSRSPGMRSRDYSPARSVGLSSSTRSVSSRSNSPSARSARRPPHSWPSAPLSHSRLLPPAAAAQPSQQHPQGAWSP